jgi:hypothetical protein
MNTTKTPNESHEMNRLAVVTSRELECGILWGSFGFFQ